MPPIKKTPRHEKAKKQRSKAGRKQYTYRERLEEEKKTPLNFYITREAKKALDEIKEYASTTFNDPEKPRNHEDQHLNFEDLNKSFTYSDFFSGLLVWFLKATKNEAGDARGAQAIINRATLSEKKELDDLQHQVEDNYKYQVRLFIDIYEDLQKYHPDEFPLETCDLKLYLRDSNAIVVTKEVAEMSDEDERGLF